MERRLLLLSSAAVYKGEWLDYAEREMSEFLANSKEALFVPYATFRSDYDYYAELAKNRFAKLGIYLTSAHQVPNLAGEILRFNSIIVGGGNTFRLLKNLQDQELMRPLAEALNSGVPYLSWSAGSNIACPTIRTTNDMAIVTPRNLDGLNQIPFQINPHYLDPDPNSHHLGETREERINEFYEEKENTIPVIGLKEGAMLRVERGVVELQGLTGARVFRKGQPSVEYLPPTRFDLNLNAY